MEKWLECMCHLGPKPSGQAPPQVYQDSPGWITVLTRAYWICALRAPNDYADERKKPLNCRHRAAICAVIHHYHVRSEGTIWSHFYPAELGAFLAPTKGKKRQAFAAPALSPALRCTGCHHLHGTLLRNTLREKQPGGSHIQAEIHHRHPFHPRTSRAENREGL